MGLTEKAFSEWYTLAVAVGVALLAAALVAKHQPLLLIGLGLVFIGLGEFINHPFITAIERDGLTHNIYSGRPRRNKVHGWLLVIIGGALGALGLFRLVALA